MVVRGAIFVVASVAIFVHSVVGRKRESFWRSPDQTEDQRFFALWFFRLVALFAFVLGALMVFDGIVRHGDIAPYT